MPRIDLASLSGMVQQYISRKYAAALIDRTKVAELKAYIAQYLYDTGFTVDGYTEKTLAERLYSEMAEYSVLTHYLDDPDVEEININGWDDIAITHLDGRIEKTKEHFFSPQHAEDVVKKLLQHSGMIIDNASPLAQGQGQPHPHKRADRGNARFPRNLHPIRRVLCRCGQNLLR